MNYFNDIHFNIHQSFPESRGRIQHEPIYYSVQYNHAGRFYLKIGDGERFEAEGAWAFITHPGAVFHYGPLSPTRHHNFIGCSHGPRIARYIESGLMPIRDDAPLIRIADPERFLELMLRIISLLDNATPSSPPPRAVLGFEELLLMLHEHTPAKPPVPAFQREYFAALAETVRRHPERQWDFAKCAGERHLSPAHFRRLFKFMTGMPPRHFLILCRMRRAAELLLSTGRPSGEIAREIGIDNEFYFSRLFKSVYQIAPLEYRREYTGVPR